MKKIHTLFFALIMASTFSSAQAAFTLVDGSLVESEILATLPLQDHFDMGMEALQYCDWREAALQFRIVTFNFPNTPLGQDAFYYLGVADFNLEEYDGANEAFSQYLKCHSNPEFFEEAVTYKFAIANKFKDGARKRFFGWKRMPKWAPASSLSVQIYDEVIAAMPCHEMAAQALFAKAGYLREQRSYRQSVEVYQQLIRRFPKNEMAPQSYLAISQVYVEQSKCEAQNSDLLAFAQINLRRFQQDFPREERIVEVESNLMEMKEIYAHALFHTGMFYERKKRPSASVIYYSNAVKQFPETRIARVCQRRLLVLTGSELPAVPDTKVSEALLPLETEIMEDSTSV